MISAPATASLNYRIQAVNVLRTVVQHGRSLDPALEDAELTLEKSSLMRAVVYGVLRHYYTLFQLLHLILRKPLKNKDRDIGLLVMMGIFQLQYQRIPDYAVISETVNSLVDLGKPWAKGLVNALLRRFQRERETLLEQARATESARLGAPDWLIQRASSDWPDHWEALLQANMQQAPMFLRVNLRRISREDYQHRLADSDIQASVVERLPETLRLSTPCEVDVLPGFHTGLVSIQDVSAQWAAGLLDAQVGSRVLDACAAPGGKTLHILERQPDLAELIAIDVDRNRLAKINENLQRSSLPSAAIQLKTANVCELDDWWDGRLFQRILLDAPCSATGVIRRHPDIQILRRSSDTETLVRQQADLLRTIWPTLEPGGILLYCTCSVFRAENESQISDFLASTTDAEEVGITLPEAIPCKFGAQILTGTFHGDGFYYAKLRKKE